MMKGLKLAVGMCLIVFSTIVTAAVVDPTLSIQDMGSDAGATLTGTTFAIDATAYLIDTGAGTIDIPDTAFTLTSTGSFSGSTGSFAGTFSVDGGLLSGTFTDLSVVALSQSYQFFGDLAYTGGTLQGGLTGGRIEGIFQASSGIIAALGPVTAVPIPAAVWLFGSGLVGLAGVARRHSKAN